MLTIRFLVSGSGTWTTKLLWLTPPWISNQKSTVILNENVFHFLFTCFINIWKKIFSMLNLFAHNNINIFKITVTCSYFKGNVNPLLIPTFLIVCNESFGNSLTDSINLCYMTTTIYSYSDVNSREFFLNKKCTKLNITISHKHVHINNT